MFSLCGHSAVLLLSGQQDCCQTNLRHSLNFASKKKKKCGATDSLYNLPSLNEGMGAQVKQGDFAQAAGHHTRPSGAPEWLHLVVSLLFQELVEGF